MTLLPLFTLLASPVYASDMDSLRAQKPGDGPFVLEGYYKPGDGGGGTYYWKQDETRPDNSGTIVALRSRQTGRLVREETWPPDPRWFGARRSVRGKVFPPETEQNENAKINDKAIESCLAWIHDQSPWWGWSFSLPDGHWYVSKPVTVSRPATAPFFRNAFFRGPGALCPAPGADFRGHGVLEVQGTTLAIEDLMIIVPGTIKGMPAAHILLTRGNGGNSDPGIKIRDTHLEGPCSYAAVTNIAMELMTCDGLTVTSPGPGRAVSISHTAAPGSGIAAQPGSTTRFHFRSCYFSEGEKSVPALVQVTDNVREVSFQDCHFFTRASAVLLQPYLRAEANGSMDTLRIVNCRLETDSESASMLRVRSVWGHSWTVEDVFVGRNVQAIVDIDDVPRTKSVDGLSLVRCTQYGSTVLWAKGTRLKGPSLPGGSAVRLDGGATVED